MIDDLLKDPVFARRVVGLFTMGNHRMELINRRYPGYQPVESVPPEVYVDEEPEDPIQSLAYDPSRYPHCIEIDAR